MIVPLLLSLLASSAPSGGSSQDGLPAVRAVLQRTEATGAVREDVLVRRLVALGASVTPTLFGLLSGEGLDELLGESETTQWLCEPDRMGELALATLAEFPQLPLREFLRARCAEHDDLGTRAASLRVLGRQGSAAGLPLYFELLAHGAAELGQRGLRTTAQNALQEILRADADAGQALERPLLAAPLEQQLLVAEALASSNRGAAVALLGKLFGRDPELDLAVLDALAQLGARYPWRVADEIAPRLRQQLGGQDATLRAASARALGLLRDAQSAPGLIDSLGDTDPTVARAALWALRESSGQTRLTTRPEWQHWLEGELAWWKGEGNALLAKLDPEHAAELAGTLRALLRHPMGRDQVAAALAGVLGELEAPAKVLACGALSQLGARRAVPALVELLFEADAEVRAAAWQALRALTGEELPAEPQLWETYAFG